MLPNKDNYYIDLSRSHEKTRIKIKKILLGAGYSTRVYVFDDAIYVQGNHARGCAYTDPINTISYKDVLKGIKIVNGQVSINQKFKEE